MRSLIFFSILPAAFVLPVFAENLLSNPGFEMTGPDGNPISWSIPSSLWRLDPSGGCCGGAALKYENADPTSPRLMPILRFSLTPGRKYLASCIVKTNSSDKRDLGCKFCVEWNGPDGKWVGGAYGPSKASEVQNWRKLEIATARIPSGCTSGHIAIIVEAGFLGEAWFDDFEMEELPMKPISAFFSDRYRDAAADGRVVFSAGLNADDIPGGLDGACASFELKVADGSVKRLAAAIDGNVASASFAVDELAEGTHPVVFRLRSKTGALIGGEMDFTRMENIPLAPVRFDGRRAVVDGKPFFPLGMYWQRITERELDEYAKGPFNCLMPYHTPSRRELDLCAARGLKCIVNLCRYHCRGHFKDKKEEIAWVKDVLAYSKGHPATLAYYLNDEIPISREKELVARYRYCRENDPGHPAYAVLCDFEEVREYMSTFDAVGMDPYSIPGKDIGLQTVWMSATESATKRTRPVWQVVQTFDYGAYKPSREEAAVVVAPTIKEMRNMIWQAIASGSDGLLFYSFFDLVKMNWKKPFEKAWPEVCGLGREVKEYEHVFLSAEVPPKISSVCGCPERIPCRAWRLGGAVYVLAVNATRERVGARIVVEGAYSSVFTLIGERTALKGSDEIEIEFPPLGLAFVRLDSGTSYEGKVNKDMEKAR